MTQDGLVPYRGVRTFVEQNLTYFIKRTLEAVRRSGFGLLGGDNKVLAQESFESRCMRLARQASRLPPTVASVLLVRLGRGVVESWSGEPRVARGPATMNLRLRPP